MLRAYPFPTFSQKLPREDARGVVLGTTNPGDNRVDIGDWTYVYSCMIDEKSSCDDLRVARFGFSHEKVVWISISDSE